MRTYPSQVLRFLYLYTLLNLSAIPFYFMRNAMWQIHFPLNRKPRFTFTLFTPERRLEENKIIMQINVCTYAMLLSFICVYEHMYNGCFWVCLYGILVCNTYTCFMLIRAYIFVCSYKTTPSHKSYEIVCVCLLALCGITTVYDATILGASYFAQHCVYKVAGL